MQNYDEPFYFTTCRRERDKIASILCTAVGQ